MATYEPEPVFRRSAFTSYLLLAFAVLFWAGNFVLGRAIHAEIPPVTLAFWRWAVAAVVLLPFAAGITWRHRQIVWRERRLVATLAMLGVVVFHVCIYSGLQTTTATNAAILQAAVPVLIPGFSWFLLREAVSVQQLIGILVSLAGAAVIVLHGRPLALLDLELTSGDVWILFSVPAWALYSTLLRRLPPDLPQMAFLLTIVSVGLLILAPLYALEVAPVGGFAPSPPNMLAIAYVGLFASVISYVL